MSTKNIDIPNIGDFDEVEVIEILVAVGDQINVEDSLITVESDKASMEIPSSDSGTVTGIKVAIGDNVKEGSAIVEIELDEAKKHLTAAKKDSKSTEKSKLSKMPEAIVAPSSVVSTQPIVAKSSPTANIDETTFINAHASPAIRRFARELGVDLNKVQGSGRKNRIIKTDVQDFVKQALNNSDNTASSNSSLGVEPMPEIDFSRWGDVETIRLSKINKLTGKFLHRNWVSIPHVTQYDEADITEMEAFRKQMGIELKEQGVKITPLAFIMKAIVAGLKAYPRFNSSLSPNGETLIQKNYYHIGVAVDTPDGLVVPVIRDVDQKNVVTISQEIRDMAVKARNKKLSPSDMQGGCMSISSLGGIGGTKFTPIINAPEVAILGVSRSKMQPEWNGSEFVPRLMLPLSLSYDHRVIDGAAGARFTTYLSKTLADIRRLLL
ncbi:MAG TPA: dihydrolipoyllysine-residue acetyltransferase [Thiothrix sp.]|nr:dihydrolipoyllysine-residue acetyltransferase [Thiothrix sp.]